MAEIRLSKLIKQFNIGLDTLVDFLNSKGAGIDSPNPNLKISDEYLDVLHKQFGKDLELKEAAEKVDVKLTEILDKASSKKDEGEDDYEPEKVTVIKNNNFTPVARPQKAEVVEEEEISPRATLGRDDNPVIPSEVEESPEEPVVEEVPVIEEEPEVEEPVEEEEPEVEPEEEAEEEISAETPAETEEAPQEEEAPSPKAAEGGSSGGRARGGRRAGD